MPQYRAEINIMPHKELLDPQGKAVAASLKKISFESIQDVRIGKHITITLHADTKAEATRQIDEACKKLLANAIMESYHFEIIE